MCLLLYWTIAMGRERILLINRYILNIYQSPLMETAQPVSMKERQNQCLFLSH